MVNAKMVQENGVNKIFYKENGEAYMKDLNGVEYKVVPLKAEAASETEGNNKKKTNNDIESDSKGEIIMSRGINKMIILGWVGNEPVIKKTSEDKSGIKIASFSIATTDEWVDKKTEEKKSHVEWTNVVTFGSMANYVEKAITKGTELYLEGKKVTSKWKDKDGNEKSSIAVHPFTLHIAGGAKKQKEAEVEAEASSDEVPF